MIKVPFSTIICRLLFAIVATCLYSTAFANSYFIVDGIVYVTNDEKPDEVSVYSVIRDEVDITIPATVSYNNHNYNVTSIVDKKWGEDGAFSQCTNLQTVMLPDCMTVIGAYAFRGCKNLNNIVFPKYLTRLGQNAFAECTSLTSIVIPDGVASISGCFYGCTNLTSVELPNSLKTIGGWTFDGCTSFTSVIIPNSVSEIGAEAFNDTPWLKNQPDGIVYVGGVAYQYKGEMPPNANIKIKEGTKTINDKLFFDCPGLASIEIPSSVTKIGREAFKGCTNLASISIPQSITSIGSNAFEGTLWLNNLPDGMNYINNMAFKYKGKMEPNAKIVIKEGTTEIFPGAFSECTTPFSVEIPNSVKSIQGAFSGCVGLTSVNVPSSIKYIESGDFYGCTSLSSITIPNSVTSIGLQAFQGCSSLVSISIPNSVTSIGYYAFSGCTSLTSINIPNSVTYLERLAFYGCTNLAFVDIDMTEIDTDAFLVQGYSYEQSNLTNNIKQVNIGKNVKRIRGAFTNCENLSIVNILGDLVEIGYGSFAGCFKLSTINIPNSVTTIGSHAFYGCKFSTIDIPNSIVELDGYAFLGTPWYDNQPNGMIYINDMAYLYKGPAYGNVSIKEGTKKICSAAFLGQHNLTSVIIPNSVTGIGGKAFSGCTNLTSINIPDGVTNIGIYCFESCTSLGGINIPNSVTFIGEGCFSGCTGLRTISIPNSVIEIERLIFENCTGLTAVEIPNSVTKIGIGAFSGCTNLTSIDIPKSVMELDGFSFSGLTSIDIPEGVTSIGEFTFSDCSDLKTIRIPSSVKDMHFSAFRGCKSLSSVVSNIHDLFLLGTQSNDEALNATLIVPTNTKDLYKALNWDYFGKIIENTFNNKSVTYQIDSFEEKNVRVINGDSISLTIPAKVSSDDFTWNVTGIEENAFNGNHQLAAVVWDPAIPFTANVNNPNFLLYVKSALFAPATINNIIVNGIADEITLVDDANGNNFYCPQRFTARKIAYSHVYNMTSGKGISQGWESIALPFDAQTISHEAKGRLEPFPKWNEGSESKPFWLYQLGSNGFTEASSIKANTPYIISMPNNPDYKEEYRVNGVITFSATDATVKSSDNLEIGSSGNRTFIPNFINQDASNGFYVLNAINNYSTNAGGYDEGSHFVRNLRDVHPFEAYITIAGGSAKESIPIFDDETTWIPMHQILANELSNQRIYNLNGQQIRIEGNENHGSLKKGIYIVNGKKIVVR